MSTGFQLVRLYAMINLGMAEATIAVRMCCVRLFLAVNSIPCFVCSVFSQTPTFHRVIEVVEPFTPRKAIMNTKCIEYVTSPSHEMPVQWRV